MGRAQRDVRHRSAAVLGELRPDLSQAETRVLVAAAYGLAEEVGREHQAGVPSVANVADLMLRFLLAGDTPDAH